MHEIPEGGLLRIWQICGCSKRGVQPLIPISRSKWWDGVRRGIYPPGILLSTKTRVWSCDSIRKLIADLAATEGTR
jgi:prophage regulatory protein